MRVTSAIGSRGFTLLELLVVLTIIVLMAGAWPFAAPRLFPAQQLRNVAQQFMSDARISRLTARETGSISIIAVREDRRGYTSTAGDHNMPAGIVLNLRTEPMNTAAGRLTFFPDGSSSGGVVEFSLPGRMLSVSLGSLTGRTEILE